MRYDWSSLFGGDKNNVAPRLGLSWDVGGRHRTVVKANWGIFYDRNVLSAAATVPEKGGVFTRSAFDVALPRLGSDYTDSLIDLVITSGFPTGGGGRTPAENPLYTPMANALRSNPLAIYQLLGINVPDPSKPPVVTSDNIQQLSGKTPAQAIALLQQTWPGTDWMFFDVPGGSIVGDRVLSFFPRGPLDTSRDVSQYSQDKTPWTRAFSVGVDQEISANMTVSAMYVHRRSRDLLSRRIINLFDVPPGDPNFGKTTDGGPRISLVGYDGRINYDGVILSLRKRFSQRYQLTVSYTGSKARDNLLTGDVGSTFSNNNHPELDYGVSNQSVPHIFVANGLVVLPLDFHVSGIVYWRSGSAFSPRGIQDLDGDGLVDQRDTTQPRNGFRTKAYGDVDLRVEKQVRFLGEHRVTRAGRGVQPVQPRQRRHRLQRVRAPVRHARDSYPVGARGAVRLPVPVRGVARWHQDPERKRRLRVGEAPLSTWQPVMQRQVEWKRAGGAFPAEVPTRDRIMPTADRHRSRPA